MRRLFTACMLMAVPAMFPAHVYAQDHLERSGFIFGVAAGYGLSEVNTVSSPTSLRGSFALGFRGGYAISSKAIMGLELNGWTLQAYNVNDPSQGESISNTSVFMNYFPYTKSPVYFSAGAGQTSYTNNSPAENGRAKGGAWFIGSGYEYQVSKGLMLVPQIRYSQGNFSGGNFSVYEIALGMSWYSGNSNK